MNTYNTYRQASRLFACLAFITQLVKPDAFATTEVHHALFLILPLNLGSLRPLLRQKPGLEKNKTSMIPDEKSHGL